MAQAMIGIGTGKRNSKHQNTMNKNDIYKKVTDKVILQLETAGSWQKLWDTQMPVSLNGHNYTGLNFLMLHNTSYKSNVWGTFLQIRQNGGKVKKGEKSEMVVFWKILSDDKTQTNDDTQETQAKSVRVPLLKVYHVFNVEQCEFDDIGKQRIAELEKVSQDKQEQRKQEAESIIANMQNRPQIEELTTDKAAYSPIIDKIIVPYMKYFESPDEYYHALFHELVHSTGHESRLNRKMCDNLNFDREVYSKEELVAEMGSAFLSVIAGLKDSTQNSAAYIRGWSSALKDNHSWIMWVANKAQQAVDYITNA